MKRLTKKQRKILWRSTLAVAAVVVFTIVWIAETKFSQLVLGGLGDRFSTQVLSAPLTFRAGSTPPGIRWRTLSRLHRLGYKQTNGSATEPGQFTVNGDEVQIFFRGFESPTFNQPAALVRIQFKSAGLELHDDSVGMTPEVALEPVLIDTLSGQEKIRRDPATWEEIPVRLADAVVATEDAGFFRHWGVSPRSIGRAILSNVEGNKTLQGGSTITQQLAKNLFLSPQRTLQRKLAELLFAFYLEIRFSKEKILTLYLNQIYMGQDGPTSVAGIKAAARYYFDKDLPTLNLAECAFLAGLVRSPYRYNPYRDPHAALERTHHVIKRMRVTGFINESEEKEALSSVLQFHSRNFKKKSDTFASYYVAEVVRQLSPKYGEDDIYRLGLRLYTAMDPDLQEAAQKAVSRARPQGALVALNPENGDILALAGGTDFVFSQFNRATQARRQPGSAFKPFVYGAALEAGETPATLLEDKPRSYRESKNKTWSPKNYDGVYHGTVPLRVALALSLNGATVSLVEKITPAKVVAFANRLGITSPLEKSLAIGLGSSEVTLLELTSAYAAFDNGGFRVSPRLLLAVTDAEGQSVEVRAVDRTSVIDPNLASLMTSLLESTVAEGTAKALPQLGWTYPTAAKTGTTNEGRDAWFIGYTSDLLTGVWVGTDLGKSAGVVGAKNAMPVWASFMKTAYTDSTPAAFTAPSGLVQVKIDPATGFLAQSGCPEKKEEVFLKGTEPTKLCPAHPGGIKGWFKRIFGK